MKRSRLVGTQAVVQVWQMGEAGQGMSLTCGKDKEFCLVQLTLPN